MIIQKFIDVNFKVRGDSGRKFGKHEKGAARIGADLFDFLPVSRNFGFHFGHQLVGVFARLEFPGKDLIFISILATMMIPEQVKMIPSFIVLRELGWIDTFTGLIVPALVHPFGIFMLRQFFLSIPKELEDAARIDGSSRLGILWRIILPVSKAPISALAVFVFMFQWNAFLWPLIVLNSQENYTLQIGLAMLRGDVGTDYALQMAATAVATLPLVVLFLIAQKQFIRGITLTGLKY